MEIPTYIRSENGGFPQDGNLGKSPVGQEIPKTQEIHKSWEFPRNSHVGDSREGKVRSHTGGREWEFPVEHPYPG